MKSLAFHPDGDLIVGGDAEGEIIGWDIRSGRQEFHLRIEHKVSCLAWSPRGDCLAASCPDGLLIWRVTVPGHPC